MMLLDYTLFTYVFTHTVDVREPHPGGEMIRTGRTERVESTWGCLARSREVALAAYQVHVKHKTEVTLTGISESKPVQHLIVEHGS